MATIHTGSVGKTVQPSQPADSEQARDVVRVVPEVLPVPSEKAPGPHPAEGPSAEPARPKVSIRGVNISFAGTSGIVQALADVNLEIDEGEFVCLIGPSGCGKSTLLQAVAGLQPVDSGTIAIDGTPVPQPSPDRVMMFQEPALFPWLTVQKNVEFGLKMAGLTKPERHARACRYIRMVHLTKFCHSYPHELSGGMKQRAALARALALDPDLLLMDEPFASLDAQTRDILHQELQGIWQQTGKTIIFVTHNVWEAVCLGDRVAVISARPGHVKRVFDVNLPRPRDIGSVEVLETSNLIMGELKIEVDKVVKEELDEQWRPPKGRFLRPPGFDMGSGI